MSESERKELTRIVKEVQKDINQFERLYLQIIDKIYFWCYTITGNEHAAKDLTQDSIIQIYEKIKDVQKPEYFSTWMYKLVRNKCYKYLNLSKNSDKLVLDSEDYMAGYEDTAKEERKENLPDEAYDLKETNKLVVSFIDNLPKRQKEVITLFYLEDFKIDEIAEILDYNSGSVKSRLHAGRRNLEQQISEYQKKYHVKLYSVSVLTSLGHILREHCSETYNQQDLSLSQTLKGTGKASGNLPGTGNLSLMSNLISAAATKVVIVIALAVVCAGAAAYVVDRITSEPVNNAVDSKDPGADLNDDSDEDEPDLSEKLEGHPYIDDIIYLKFPMRISVSVSIKLKQEVDTEMKILFQNTEVPFEKREEEILLEAKENGRYTIVTDGYEVSFEIDNIDVKAPELTGTQNYGDYVQLLVDDEQAQIDYQRSFVSYRGETYKIDEDLKVYGQFVQSGTLTLMNRGGDYIVYNLNFD